MSRRLIYLLSTRSGRILAILCLAVCCGSLAHAQKVAAVRGHTGSSVGDMLAVYADEVITYGEGSANISGMWADLDSFDMIWLGFPNNNAGVFDTFTANADAFQAWLTKGGKFVATTASSDVHQVYDLMPGTVATQNQHRANEAAQVVDPSHALVTMPNDISDDAYYTAWAWTSGDIYTAYDGYDVIASETNGDPSWIVHKSMPIVLTTIQPTWSGHQRPEMVQNIFEYVQNFAFGTALNPIPENEAVDVLRDTDLSWQAGEFAVQHDVFVGTNFDDVNDATSTTDPAGAYQGRQSETGYVLDRLDFGQTYYWRVDEVNGAPDRTVFKGKVWSFTVEPFSIPVDAITATASSSNAANMGPENTIGGVGLNELDQHSVEPTDMWLSGVGDATPTLQYEFDKAYKLDQMLVWNSNQLIEAFVGLGTKDVVIEYSTDGAEWTALEGATQFAQATGTPTYTANTLVDFGGVMARFVKISIESGYGPLGQYGLSAVRFLYIPTFAREPLPAEGDTTGSANVVLSWRAGREAAAHEVYLGTDAANLSLIGSADENSYDAGALDFGTTYFWQVVEVNEAETPTAHAGPIWSLNTPAFGVVDNFDSYDDNCNRIFFAWEDGLGHNGGTDIDDCDVAPSNGNGGGSIVGNSVAPFAEQAIVRAGTQSLPMLYDNAFGASEATLSFAAQDWTVSGIGTLALSFFGDADNTGQLYLKINSTKLVYDGDADDIKRPRWQPWNIDLGAVGGNLQNVTSLSIGVDGATAAGIVYIDSIGLYPQAPAFITPEEPDGASLMIHYPFDGNVLDSSGQGVDGEAMGAPTYGNGVDGQAIQLNGIDDYVNLVLDVPENGATTAFWFNTSNPDSGLHAVVQNLLGGGGHDRHIFLIDGDIRIRLYNTEIITATGSQVADGQWHHVAYTYGDDVGGQQLYIDGLLQASGTKAQSDFDWQERVHFGFSNDAANNYLEGMLDDARIYNRTLTAAEIAWLAGKREPMPKQY